MKKLLSGNEAFALEAYDLMAVAFEISERFDTPVLVRSSTRISHSKSVVESLSLLFEQCVIKGTLLEKVCLGGTWGYGQ